MSTAVYFTRAKLRQRLHQGPLDLYIDLYATRLLKEGHGRRSAQRCLHIVGDFNHWLTRKQLGIGDVNEWTVEQYSRYRCPYLSDRPALKRLLSVLREAGAIAPKSAVVLGPLEQIVEDFQRHLSQERGLAPASIIRHLPVLRRFLRETCGDGAQRLSRLTRADITGFVERHARDHSPKSGRLMCWTLRAFLRYLQYRDHIAIDLAVSVPTVRTWRLTSLPTCLSSKQVQQVLNACDRRTAIGRRDYAILMLLARLGLRAKEIASLTLDDLDWGSGQLTVRGKGRRKTQMPLPPEVGAAIADYLQRDRPRSDSRHVFLRSLAPLIGFGPSGISVLAKRALTRAGFDDIPRKGAHVFRHSLATELLRAGASLTEIGQVLRHQDHDTTRLYAKVDIDALRTLGLRWPGGAR
jgi:site-specific recombinase XerD